MDTFADLPEPIRNATSRIIARGNPRDVRKRIQTLHEQYMHSGRERSAPRRIVKDFMDVQAYLALRFAATYAQIYGALSQLQTVMPEWKPKRILDIGTGPGTGIWAAHAIWPTIDTATGIDQIGYFLAVASEFQNNVENSPNVFWKKQPIDDWIIHSDTQAYDIILVANVLNELSYHTADRLVNTVSKSRASLVVFIEPGTEQGAALVHKYAQKLTEERTVIAPYVGGSVVSDKKARVYFSQRFHRPDNLRRIRQDMRDSSRMAADWEEAAYSYVAASNTPLSSVTWGRCIGPVKKHTGYLVFPVLTATGIQTARVLKRNKDEYAKYLRVRWGDVLFQPCETIA